MEGAASMVGAAFGLALWRAGGEGRSLFVARMERKRNAGPVATQPRISRALIRATGPSHIQLSNSPREQPCIIARVLCRGAGFAFLAL